MTITFPRRRQGVALPDFVDAAAIAHPHKVALSFGAERVTFSQLRQSVSAAATLLSTAAERSGRIGILSANRPGYVIATLAATRSTTSFVPLNWRQAPEEIAWQIRSANLTTLIVDGPRDAAAEAAIANEPVAIIDIAQFEQSHEPDGAIPPAPPIHLDREAAVIFTSGTSGRPKGARISYGNLWFAAIGSSLRLGHSSHDVWLGAMPLFHIGGLAMLYRGLIGGNEIILQERFDPDRALAAIDTGATLVSLVPTMLRRMIDRRPVPWPPTLRRILLGGGPAPIRLMQDALRLGLPIAPTYGLTESTSQVATLEPSDLPRKLGSSGIPLPTTSVRIVGGSLRLPPGQIGEIEVSGPTIFDGYLEGPSLQYAESGRWFATGDAGYFDDDGYLFVVDRRNDLIVSGGENVYPAEIERVLLEHPLVHDAGVVALPNEEWGARPVAAVVWNGAPEAAEATLLEHCRDRVAAYKIPDRIILLSAIPRSPAGKLLRGSLRALLTSEED